MPSTVAAQHLQRGDYLVEEATEVDDVRIVSIDGGGRRVVVDTRDEYSVEFGVDEGVEVE